jgi:MipA family protein
MTHPSVLTRWTAPMAAAVALLLTAQPVLSQNNGLAFSLSASAQSAPAYFGAKRVNVRPELGFGFQGLRLGGFVLGELDTTDRFPLGTGLRGAFRVLAARDGTAELAGLTDIKTAVELGIGLHHTAPNWQVYGELRKGVTGHTGVAGDLGANVILRPMDGLTLHAGPRAAFGDTEFARTYFGITPAEATESGLATFAPSGGLHSVGFEIGGYQALNRDWGVNARVRYDRLQGDAAASPIVRQGNRDQVTAAFGLTRNFNFRF